MDETDRRCCEYCEHAHITRAPQAPRIRRGKFRTTPVTNGVLTVFSSRLVLVPVIVSGKGSFLGPFGIRI